MASFDSQEGRIGLFLPAGHIWFVPTHEKGELVSGYSSQAQHSFHWPIFNYFRKYKKIAVISLIFQDWRYLNMQNWHE